MSPAERIALKYEESPQEMPFSYYVDWHMKHGFVHATPEYFIMGRAVKLGTDFTDRLFTTPREEANAWYIHAFSGNMGMAWGVMPWALGYIAFERVRSGKRELTITPTERIRRLSLFANDESPTT